MMRRGVQMPVVQHVVKRRIVEQVRNDFVTERVRIVRQPKAPWPEPGGVEWAFQDARKQRA